MKESAPRKLDSDLKFIAELFTCGEEHDELPCPPLLAYNISWSYPTPRLLVERMVSELVSSRRWSWVTFETKPMKHFIEVALQGDDELVVNVAYGFSEDYEPLFERQRVVIPDDWRVSKFKKKSWFGTGTMLLTTSIRDVHRVAEFVDRLFLALYGEQQGYSLSGVYQS